MLCVLEGVLGCLVGCDAISLTCTKVSEDPPASIFRID